MIEVPWDIIVGRCGDRHSRRIYETPLHQRDLPITEPVVGTGSCEPVTGSDEETQSDPPSVDTARP